MNIERIKKWRSPKKTVVVLGMHRSGTSMLSSIIQALGFSMGEKLLPPYKDNKFGYYEDADFYNLNEKILTKAGGSWFEPPTQQNIHKAQDEYKQEVIDVIQQKNSQTRWGWKDPRTVLTIDTFLPHLYNPHIIVCERDTEAIVKSIIKRGDSNNEDIIRGVIKEYERRIEEFLSKNPNLPAIHIKYEKILKNPKKYIRIIELFLGLGIKKENEKKAMLKIKPSERHH